jgi:DNA-binding transcriptional LysR family regulator
MRRFASTLSDRISGSLIMGTSHHIGLHRLPPLLKAFKKAYPDVGLDIRFMDSEQACHAVEQGELELAIVTLPSVIPDNLVTRPIWTDLLQVVVNHEHALANKTSVSLEELIQHPCVLPGSTTYTHNILKEALYAYRLDPIVNMTTNYLETLKMLVITGFGWSLIPHTMIDEQLVTLNTELKLERQLGSVTHRKRALSNAARVMLKIVSSG